MIELGITELGITLPVSINFVGILYFLINVPLFYVSFKVMAKAYTIKSIITVIVLSGVLMAVPIPKTPIINDYLTASIVGGLIGGVGSFMDLQLVKLILQSIPLCLHFVCSFMMWKS